MDSSVASLKAFFQHLPLEIEGNYGKQHNGTLAGNRTESCNFIMRGFVAWLFTIQSTPIAETVKSRWKQWVVRIQGVTDMRNS
jgi:hypothetical protein